MGTINSNPPLAIVTGDFSHIGKTYRANRLIRLNTDGSRDTSFNVDGEGFDGDVYGTAIQTDGKILVFGNFIKYNGFYSKRMIRLNADGSIDNTFSVGIGFAGGFSNKVYNAFVRSDGKIYVLGNFTTYQSVAASGIVRLNSDGSRDTGFAMGTGFNEFRCSSMYIQPDNKIIVVGDFGTYQGVSRPGIVRLNDDGTVDGTFNNGAANQPSNTFIFSIKKDTISTQLYACGYIREWNSVVRGHMIKLNPDGTWDNTHAGYNVTGALGAGTTFSFDIQSDGSVIGIDAGNTTGRIFKLNPAGVPDATFITNIGTGFNSTTEGHPSVGNSGGVSRIKVQSDDKILVFGYFSTFNGQPARFLIRLNADGTVDNTFTAGNLAAALPGTNNDFMGDNNVNIQADGKILLAGKFKSYGKATRVAMIDSNGQLVDKLSLMNHGFDGTVYSAKKMPGADKIYFAGNFTAYNNELINRILRTNYKGVRDTTFNPGTGLNGAVTAKIMIDKDGKILVGGSFTTYNGVTVNRIVRINPDGTRDATFDAGSTFTSGQVHSILIDNANQKIYVSTSAISGGLRKLNWDGTVDGTFVITSNANGLTTEVRELKMTSTGKIVCVGTFFTYAGSTTTKGIAVLNPDGTLYSGFINATDGFEESSSTLCADVDSQDRIYVGGRNSTYKAKHAGYAVVTKQGAPVIPSGNVTKTIAGEEVYDAVVDGNRTYLVGSFETMNGLARGGVVALNPDGTLDDTFDVTGGFGGNTGRCAALSDDGKLYVGGNFTTYKTSAFLYNYIFKTNLSGVKDNGFDFTGFAGANAYTGKSVVDSNGKIYVCGNFTSYRGVTEYSLIRLNADGSKDTGFDTGTGFVVGANSGTAVVIRAITIDPVSGKIYVGGSFKSYRGVTANRIIRLNDDGTVDNAFTTTNGFMDTYGTVYDIVIDPATSKIYVCGSFMNFEGVSANRIIRLNTDGTRDNAFNVGTGFMPGSAENSGHACYSMALDSNGKLYCVGSFLDYNGLTSQNRIIRLNPDGTKDTGFDNTTGFNQIATFVVVDGNDKPKVGGNFTTYKGTTVNYIVGINTDGTIDTGFVTGTGLTNLCTKIRRVGSQFYVTGQFLSYNGNDGNGIVKINSDGSVDNSFVNKDLYVGGNFRVEDIAISGSNVYLFGTFNSGSDNIANRILRINTDGSNDSGFSAGAGFNGTVQDIVKDANGKLYCVGDFTTYKGLTNNRIIRLNPDGSKDTGFDNTTGFGGGTYRITIDPATGKLYVVGDFSTYKGVTANKIIRLNTDGSIDSTFVIGTALNFGAYGIALDAAGNVYVGGSFTLYNGTPVGGIAKIFPNGTLDTSFNTGDGSYGPPTAGVDNNVNGMYVDSDGKVYVGGYFSEYKGVRVNKLVRLNQDGSIDNTAFSDNGVAYGAIYRIKEINNNIYLFGYLSGYKVPQKYLFRLKLDGSLDESFKCGIAPTTDDYGSSTVNTAVEKVFVTKSRIYVAGWSIKQYSKHSAVRLLCLFPDGTIDKDFDMSVGADDYVYDVEFLK